MSHKKVWNAIMKHRKKNRMEFDAESGDSSGSVCEFSACCGIGLVGGFLLYTLRAAFFPPPLPAYRDTRGMVARVSWETVMVSHYSPVDVCVRPGNCGSSVSNAPQPTCRTRHLNFNVTEKLILNYAQADYPSNNNFLLAFHAIIYSRDGTIILIAF